jgi:hypothetical protein
MDLYRVETELQKRLQYPYVWGKMQNNLFDSKTNFIYSIFEFEKLLTRIDQIFKGNEKYNEYFNYAINRWYNFWSARAVEEIFCNHPIVEPFKDPTDKRADFIIKGFWFDHKTTIFPAAFGKSLEYAQKNPKELVEWLYNNQSQQQRKHYYNRLFIVLHDAKGSHWKLKAEIIWLKELIMSYLDNFNKINLISFHIKYKELTHSDIIWGIRN